MNSPINVTRYGHTTQVGNAAPVEGATPQMQTLARSIHPNDPQAQSQFIAGQLGEVQKQKSAAEVARGRGAEAAGVRGQATQAAAETRAQGGIQQAQIKADAVASGTDKRFEGEQGRDAANILKQMMHDNPGAPVGDQIKALRAGNISDELIKHLVNPTSPAPQGRRMAPQQPTQAAPTNAPSVATPKAQAPEIRYDQNGNAFMKGPDGKPVPYQPGQ